MRIKSVQIKLAIIEQNYNGNEYTFVHDYKNLFSNNSIIISEYVNNKTAGSDY